jgi:AcrR family transcriptional regulator
MSRDEEPAWRIRRRKKILDAAAKLFGRAAYDAVQMDQVARAAGVGKPTLYRYFPSKDELFLEISSEAMRRLAVALEAERQVGASPPETLAAMIRLLVDTLSGQLASLRMLTGEHSVLAERWRRMLRRQQRPITASLRDVLEAGMAAGDFHSVDVEVAPALIIGMVRGGVVGVMEIPRQRIARSAMDLVLSGVSRPSRAKGGDARGSTPKRGGARDARRRR